MSRTLPHCTHDQDRHGATVVSKCVDLLLERVMSDMTHFQVCVRGNSRKSDFLGKTLRTRNFFGATTHGILTHSAFRKCSRFGWPSLRFEVTAAQSEVVGQKPEVLQKIRGVTKN